MRGLPTGTNAAFSKTCRSLCGGSKCDASFTKLTRHGRVPMVWVARLCVGAIEWHVRERCPLWQTLNNIGYEYVSRSGGRLGKDGSLLRWHRPKPARSVLATSCGRA